MTQWLISLVSTWGYIAIFLTMTGESAGLPISSEIVVPLGGALAVDYGFLLHPPEFLIPQRGPTGNFDGTPAVFRLKQGHLHFRITQTF